MKNLPYIQLQTDLVTTFALLLAFSNTQEKPATGDLDKLRGNWKFVTQKGSGHALKTLEREKQ